MRNGEKLVVYIHVQETGEYQDGDVEFGGSPQYPAFSF